MKLSRKFVEDYIDLPDISIKEIADAMTNVGNEYDHAAPLINATGLVIGEITKAQKHPNAETLNLTEVDIKTEKLTIVCGAPNVRVGLKVVVAKPGAVLPGGQITPTPIRGITSNGMICSLPELGLDTKFLPPNAHEMIHELGDDAVVGEDPIKYLNFDDEVIDFELTSNRGDLLSIIGMAYELGAIYKKEVKTLDSKYTVSKDSIEGKFNLKVETEDCPTILIKKVENVTIKESPEFIKSRLMVSGIRSINNVVDISNYVMLETGQPLHFYDADALGDTIIVRAATEGEELVTLNNNKKTLSKDDIVIADNNRAVGLAGVMGGLDTEVESHTKNIIIESAIFDSIKIRKTSKKFTRSEASNRYEKGIDPARTHLAVERACHLLEKYADATIISGLVKHDKSDYQEKEIEVPFSKISRVLGLTIPEKEIVEILKSLSFEVSTTKDSVKVKAPTRRPDLKIKEDIIEEIGRIYGIDNIKGQLPLLNAKVGSYNKTKREIRNKMISFGLNETLSYTLIPESEVKKYTTDEFTHVLLADPMSEERNTLRYSLIHSLKEVYDYNKARNISDISIFEIGAGFAKKDSYQEETKLACLISGNYHLGIKKEAVDFFTLKGILEELLEYLGFSNRYSLVIDKNIPSELHPKQSASIVLQGEHIGVIGKIHPKETTSDLYVFELNLDKLLKNKSSKMKFSEISKFPSITKDLAFIIKKDFPAGTLVQEVKKAGGKLLTNIEIFDVYTGQNVKEDEKSIALNLTFADSSKTLSDEEVMIIFNKIIKEVEKRCKAQLRSN